MKVLEGLFYFHLTTPQTPATETDPHQSAQRSPKIRIYGGF
jgi:hypothetical protein